MVRGTITRQPAKTGRHEGARRVPKITVPPPTYRRQERKTPALARSAPRLRSAQARGGAPKSSKYDPVAPERVEDILKRMDERYPKATCALFHKSPWELDSPRSFEPRRALFPSGLPFFS